MAIIAQPYAAQQRNRDASCHTFSYADVIARLGASQTIHAGQKSVRLPHLPGGAHISDPLGHNACCVVTEDQNGNVLVYCHRLGSSSELYRALQDAMGGPIRQGVAPPRIYPPAPADDNGQPLKELSDRDARLYLAGITQSDGGTIIYRNRDGRRAKHFRNPALKTRNPGMTGPGWQPRIWMPAGTPTAIVLTEGEKDAAIACLLGYIAASIPGGASRAKSADWEPVADVATTTGLPVLFAGDNDAAGRTASADTSAALAKLGVALTDIPFPDGFPVGDSILDCDPDIAIGIIAENCKKLLFDTTENENSVERKRSFLHDKPIRPPELRCTGGIWGHVHARTHSGGEVGQPLDCGKCANCNTWRKILKGKQWVLAMQRAGWPTPTLVTVHQPELSMVRHLTGAIARLIYQADRRKATRNGTPAPGPRMRLTAVRWAVSGVITSGAVAHIAYVDGLSEADEKMLRRHAARHGYSLTITHGAISASDIEDLLPDEASHKVYDDDGEEVTHYLTSGFSVGFPDWDAPTDYQVSDWKLTVLEENAPEPEVQDLPPMERAMRKCWKRHARLGNWEPFHAVQREAAANWLANLQYTLSDIHHMDIPGYVGPESLLADAAAALAGDQPYTPATTLVMRGALDAPGVCSHCGIEPPAPAMSPEELRLELAEYLDPDGAVVELYFAPGTGFFVGDNGPYAA